MDIGYFCDIIGGFLGFFVFNIFDNKVIVLYYFGGCEN